MDPRTSAKVTAPDLLEAFHEHAPRQDAQPASDLRIYLVLTVSNEVVHAETFGFDQLETVLERLGSHLSAGGERGGFIVTSTETPPLFLDAQEALSAIEA